MEKVYVKGLPFIYRGWNKCYIWNKEQQSFVSEAYILYSKLLFFIGGIPIKSTRIRKTGRSNRDRWIFEVFEEGNWNPIGVMKPKKIGTHNFISTFMPIESNTDLYENPMGLWSILGYECQVQK